MSTPVATDTAFSADYASACEALERDLVEDLSLNEETAPGNPNTLGDCVSTITMAKFKHAHGRYPTLDWDDIREKARLLKESRAATREDGV